ncbi:hypothetical protein BCR42DRAFT_400991 [Absidia repens]|uniref:Uncharacterized protein n=1 Tax=Absidia repens TaxID=90262 RepID=A0A1X2J1X2_9FUNG|nr:hypothetical protein BCR42DRAFT_400991 [Absidia repens]
MNSFEYYTFCSIVTGPYTTKNEPIIEDKRLDRARPVMHLDRRTHRGDPPAWLPAFWSKPGVYPLSPESVSIIKMVSSLPFDRHTTTTNALPSTGATGTFGAGSPLVLPPMVTMMPHILRQQQYQRMLQFQFQRQQQQLQLNSISPVTSTASSSYTQRKPITPHIPIGNTIPHLQSASYFSSPSPVQADSQKKKKKKQQTSPPTPLPLVSTPSIQRKEVAPLTGERRVRFTEDEPQVTIFEPDAPFVDEVEDVEFADDNSIYATDYTGSDDEYYDGDGVMMGHGASHYYDENECHLYNDRYGYADDLVDYDIDCKDDYIHQYDNVYANDGSDDGRQHRYYWNETSNEDEYQRPYSSTSCGKAQDPNFYLAPLPRHRNKQHYSSLSSSAQGPEPQQQQHHSLTARRPPSSSTNPRMWQPSRGQRHDSSVARPSSTGMTNSQQYRSMNA